VTALGIALAGCSLLLTMLLEGSSPLALAVLPAILLVFGGTFGAAIAGSTLADVRRIGTWFRLAFAADRGPQAADLIDLVVDLATVARRHGMLPLENRARAIEDPFLRHGLQLTVDGVPTEQLRSILEREMAAYRTDDRAAERFFARLGGYAPTVGIIGTVIGLVQVLRNLEDPLVLGPMVAGAFVATLWGVLSANFFWLPMSAKIRRNSELRQEQMTLLLTGVTEILAGTHPRGIRDRLQAMLPPTEVSRAVRAA
jgi:chemotaxis protein MotA